jgi:hypothetical protein
VEPLSASLTSYVPRWVIKSLRERWVSEDRPFALKRRASALFLDVADFTEQTGKFASRGARGAEDLSTILNGCFSVLTDTINDYDGDILPSPVMDSLSCGRSPTSEPRRCWQQAVLWLFKMP